MVGRLGWCLQPTHPLNGDQWREIGLKHFLWMLETQHRGWSPYRTSASGGGHGATLLNWEGDLGFPQPSCVLQISPAENTASPAWCLGDGFYPPGNISVILLRGRYRIKVVMHLSTRYRRTKLSVR